LAYFPWLENVTIQQPSVIAVIVENCWRILLIR
jgi:hypothetical protein